MVTFNFDIVNDEKKPVTPLGSHFSLVEEFVLQFNNVVTDAIVDTLVIEFDQVKYEEFLHKNNSISPSKISSFRKAR